MSGGQTAEALRVRASAETWALFGSVESRRRSDSNLTFSLSLPHSPPTSKMLHQHTAANTMHFERPVSGAHFAQARDLCAWSALALRMDGRLLGLHTARIIM